MGLSPPITDDIITLDQNASYNISSNVKVRSAEIL